MSTNVPTHRVVIELRWGRRSVLSIMAVLVIAAVLMLVTVALARPAASPAAPSLALAAPTVVSYQGRVSVNGQPFSGMGYFKFSIVNMAGTAAYWSNDGTGLATAPFTPTNSVTLNVSNGLFSVLLGDTSLPGMTRPMKPDAFAAPDHTLRVWFNDNTHGWQQLAPDVRVASVPYALNAEFARTSPNLQRIALLKWYTAISTTQVLPVGVRPSGIAFDGVNMWVANSGSNSVSVLRASDGNHGMTPTVGINPAGIAFDGMNMWVTNGGSGSVSVLRASDGFKVMTPTVGEGPWGIAFDGANMWVANSSSNSVSVIRASDGNHVMTPTVGEGPWGVAFDGANMWVTNGNDNFVNVLRARDGFKVMTPTVGSGFSGPDGIAFDGTNMWVTLYGGDTVKVLRASDGSLVTTVPVGGAPSGIAFDGANMWVANHDDNTVSKR